jgi:hypothetical protein
MSEDYTQLVDEESTVLVRFWKDGTVEVALRKERGDTWGPPKIVREEK